MKILHFADLHIGVESYGHIDPATGLSTRLLDILSSLDQLVDYAIDDRVDLVVFCGDAYKSREPSQTHQREFAKRISRLSAAGIPVFLLTGNHDLPNAVGRATSTEIFSTLEVKNVYVSSRPEVYRIPTKSGTVQVASLPWLRRSAVLSRDDTRSLNFEQITERMQASLSGIIAAHVEKLDRSLPSILAAHVWVAGARLGTEKTMTIGQEHTLLLSTIAKPAFDYVALGHIHRGQVLSENPPVVYSGSLNRLDFGDEGDEKGFYIVDINLNSPAGKWQAKSTFHPVRSRRFATISVTVEPGQADAMAVVLESIEKKAEEIKDAIVRLHIIVPAELDGQLNDNALKSALIEASFLTISRDVKRQARVRLGNFSAEDITPMDALKVWLESQNTGSERIKVLLEHGQKLIDGAEE
ncbi:MAG: exonuclease SbcCD subunit D [Dehalococcoidia bacterium]|nr:exonuclease SbcCD subunit D [Dehalococcoidia bacterium]